MSWSGTTPHRDLGQDKPTGRIESESAPGVGPEPGESHLVPGGIESAAPARVQSPATLIRRKSLPVGTTHHKPLSQSRQRSVKALGRVAEDAERLLEGYLEAHRPIQAQRLTMSLARALEADLGHWEWSLPQRLDRAAALSDQLEHLQIMCQPLLQCLTTCSAWADGDLVLSCTAPIEYLANPVLMDLYSPRKRHTSWLRHYPVQLLTFGAGVAAVARERYQILNRLLCGVSVPTPFGNDVHPLALDLFAWSDLEQDVLGQLPDVPAHGSLLDHLHAVLEPSLREVTGRPALYDNAFDRFATLLTCLYADEYEKAGQAMTWIPQERITGSVLAGGAAARMETEARRAGDAWPPVQAGLFHGSLARFLELLHRVEVLRGNRLEHEPE